MKTLRVFCVLQNHEFEQRRQKKALCVFFFKSDRLLYLVLRSKACRLSEKQPGSSWRYCLVISWKNFDARQCWHRRWHAKTRGLSKALRWRVASFGKPHNIKKARQPYCQVTQESDSTIMLWADSTIMLWVGSGLLCIGSELAKSDLGQLGSLNFSVNRLEALPMVQVGC